jgi:hypothetical protein
VTNNIGVFKQKHFFIMRNKTEAKSQAEIVEWFNNNYCLKHHSPRGIIFSVPNGGSRNKVEAMTLKATGLLAGASDTILILPTGKLVFCEVKTETGSQSPKQNEFQKRVEALGFEYWLVRGLEDFQKKVYQSLAK